MDTGRQVGQLAKRFFQVELPLQVCSGNAGYFIGTVHPTDGPYSRESAEYFPDKEDAEKALATGRWTQLVVDG